MSRVASTTLRRGGDRLADVDRQERRGRVDLPRRERRVGCTSPKHAEHDVAARRISPARPGCRNGRCAWHGAPVDAAARRAPRRRSALAAKTSAGGGRRRASPPSRARPTSSAPSAWCSSAQRPGAAPVDACRTRRSRGPPAPRARLWRAMSSSEPMHRRAQHRLLGSDIGLSSTTRSRSVVALGRQQPVRQRRVGERPADDLEQPAADERVLGAAAQALGVASAARAARCGSPGSSRGAARAPSIRATSSIRSASRVTSPRRQCGTPTSSPSSARRRRRSRARRGSRRCARAATSRAEQPGDARVAQRGSTGVGLAGPTRRRACPATSRAPVSSSISAVGDGLGLAAQPSGGRPFSKRAEASLRRPSFHEVRVDVRAVPGRDLHQDAGRARRATSLRSPPMTPAIDVGPVGVLDDAHVAGRACASGRRAS